MSDSGVRELSPDIEEELTAKTREFMSKSGEKNFARAFDQVKHIHPKLYKAYLESR